MGVIGQSHDNSDIADDLSKIGVAVSGVGTRISNHDELAEQIGILQAQQQQLETIIGRLTAQLKELPEGVMIKTAVSNMISGMSEKEFSVFVALIHCTGAGEENEFFKIEEILSSLEELDPPTGDLSDLMDRLEIAGLTLKTTDEDTDFYRASPLAVKIFVCGALDVFRMSSRLDKIEQ